MINFDLVMFDLADRQQGLLFGVSTNLEVEFVAYIPTDACLSYAHMCVEITPGLEASYAHPMDYAGNMQCLNATRNIQCGGKYCFE